MLYILLSWKLILYCRYLVILTQMVGQVTYNWCNIDSIWMLIGVHVFSSSYILLFFFDNMKKNTHNYKLFVIQHIWWMYTIPNIYTLSRIKVKRAQTRVKHIIVNCNKKQTWTTFKFQAGWLMSFASETFFWMPTCRSSYDAVSRAMPGNKSEIRLRNNGSSSSTYKQS